LKKIFEEAEQMIARDKAGGNLSDNMLDNDPDYILLVGQSSRIHIPDLKSLCKEVFPRSAFRTYEKSERLKTCVCEGAVKVGMQILVGVEVFNSLESFIGRARSSIGRMDLDTRLRRVLVPLVRKGDRLPAVGKMNRSIREGMLVEVMENFGFNNVFDQAADDMEPIDMFVVEPGRINGIDPSELKNASLELSITQDETVDLAVVVHAGDQISNSKRVKMAAMNRSN
jgi:hypothetical protein